jgi:hypothetical protein
MSLIFDVCLTLQGIDCWEWLSQIHDVNKVLASLCLIASSLLLPQLEARGEAHYVQSIKVGPAAEELGHWAG